MNRNYVRFSFHFLINKREARGRKRVRKEDPKRDSRGNKLGTSGKWSKVTIFLGL